MLYLPGGGYSSVHAIVYARMLMCVCVYFSVRVRACVRGVRACVRVSAGLCKRSELSRDDPP